MHVPVFELARPVSNVTEEHTEFLQSRLLEGIDETKIAPAVAAELFHPVSSLRAVLITRQELLGIQRYLGRDVRLDEEEMAKLGDHVIDAVTAGFSDARRKVSTLPAETQRAGDQYTLALTKSPYSNHERFIAKQAITSFLEVDLHDLPRTLWFAGDKTATHVRLATSHNYVEAKLLRRLESVFKEDELASVSNPFPGSLVLEEPIVRTWHKQV